MFHPSASDRSEQEAGSRSPTDSGVRGSRDPGCRPLPPRGQSLSYLKHISIDRSPHVLRTSWRENRETTSLVVQPTAGPIAAPEPTPVHGAMRRLPPPRHNRHSGSALCSSCFLPASNTCDFHHGLVTVMKLLPTHCRDSQTETPRGDVVAHGHPVHERSSPS